MSDEKDDKWEMPKPVFRTTSGALPRSFEETISQSFSPNKREKTSPEDDSSLHDTPTMNADEYVPIHDDEAITETPDPVSNTAAAQPRPVTVSARDRVERPETDQRSEFLIYLAITIIGLVLIIAALYYRSSPPTQ